MKESCGGSIYKEWHKIGDRKKREHTHGIQGSEGVTLLERGESRALGSTEWGVSMRVSCEFAGNKKG